MILLNQIVQVLPRSGPSCLQAAENRVPFRARPDSRRCTHPAGSSPAVNESVRPTSRTSRACIPTSRVPCASPRGIRSGRTAVAAGREKAGQRAHRDELLAFFDGRVARWWKPDAVVFVESVPLGTTGKVLKHRLREQYADYYLSA
jgi:acyl-CoA synthetase (AMP-forming)/AMP-acid ligase II